MSNDALHKREPAAKPCIVFYDRNPIAMLDLELSLLELLGEAARLHALASPSEVSHVAIDASVVLFLLDGKVNASAFEPLNQTDPRIILVVDRPEIGKPHIEKRPSRFSLSKIPAIAHLIKR